MALAYTIATDFRTQVDDTDTADPLWSDAEVIRYMNLAVREMAKKTLCINDSQTVAVTQLAVTEDSPWVPFSPLVLEFDPMTVYSQGQLKNYPIVSKYDFLRDQGHSDDYGKTSQLSGWQANAGTPRIFISDLETESLRAYPIPDADDTLEVTIKRLPIDVITDISDSSIEVPEVPAQFHEDLIVYMQYRAYLKQDAECYDKGLAERYLREWQLDTLPEIRRMLKRSTQHKGAVSRYRSNG